MLGSDGKVRYFEAPLDPPINRQWHSGQPNQPLGIERNNGEEKTRKKNENVSTITTTKVVKATIEERPRIISGKDGEVKMSESFQYLEGGQNLADLLKILPCVALAS